MTVQSGLTAGRSATFCAWGRLGLFIMLVITMVPTLIIFQALRIPAGEKLPRIFHSLLSKIVGMKVRVRGNMVEGTPDSKEPVFFVSNHSSYLDIPVLGSIIHGSFVAKSEVGTWPFIGYMSKFQNTVFIERKAVRAGTQVKVLRDRLEAKDSLILFPEGTSSDGMRTLSFKSSLFNIVEKPLSDGAYVKVQPISMICTEIGGLPIGREWRPYYAWFGDMTLVKHVWDAFKIGDFTVDVIFHPPVIIENFTSRKELSDYCERVISDGVNQCVTGRFDKKLCASE